MPVLDQPNLDVVYVRYGDEIRFPAASGYNFVTPGHTHGVGVLRMNPGHAANPHFIGLTATSPTEYDTDLAGFTAEYLIDGNPNLEAVGPDAALHVNSTVFPVVDEFYLVAVFDTSLGGPQRHIVDLKVVYVEKASLDIFDSTSAAIDTTTLEIALGLAGDNSKMRKSTFRQGQISEFEIALFNTAVPLSLDEADIDSDVGLQKIVEATHIVDNLGDVNVSTTVRTL